MKLKKDKKVIALVLATILLIISLSLNLYQSLRTNKYLDSYQRTMYQSIEEIRSRNEHIYLATELIVDSRSISKNELLDLYNNYKMICLEEANILEANLVYENIESNLTQNNIFLRAEEFIKTILLNCENEVKSDEAIIVNLNSNQIRSIEILRDVSEEINNYFKTFKNGELEEKESDEKVDLIITEDSWVAIMEDIQEIGDKYSEYMLQ